MIQNNQELDKYIKNLDVLLEKENPTDEEQKELDKIADLIEEYETRTDILNRPLNYRLLTGNP